MDACSEVTAMLILVAGLMMAVMSEVGEGGAADAGDDDDDDDGDGINDHMH